MTRPSKVTRVGWSLLASFAVVATILTAVLLVLIGLVVVTAGFVALGDTGVLVLIGRSVVRMCETGMILMILFFLFAYRISGEEDPEGDTERLAGKLEEAREVIGEAIDTVKDAIEDLSEISNQQIDIR